MNINDYEKYYQKGGTYVLPIEIFQELWGEMENWKQDCKNKDNIINEIETYCFKRMSELDNIKEKDKKLQDFSDNKINAFLEIITKIKELKEK